jgi:hypothetical protein
MNDMDNKKSPGPSLRNKKATKLGAELDDFIKNNTDEKFSRGIRLKKAWEAIATPQMLEHTDNVVFSTKSKNPGVLVYMESSHWADKLGTQRELYRVLLEKETGWNIHDLRFFVTRKAVFKKLFQKKSKEEADTKAIKAIPLNEDEERYARELVSSIKDEELRNRLYKAVKSDFEWKKGHEGLKLSQKPPECPEST